MANNYTPSYNQYLTQTAGYVLPSSVRSYSVFDPSSNSWRRMTNDGRSPLPMTPAQEQAAVAGALMQAQQTRGKVWNPLPVPAQAANPVQMPSRGSRRRSPAPAGGGMGASPSPASGVPQKAPQGQIPAFLQAAVNREGYQRNLLPSDFANGQRTPQEAILLESATPRTAQPYQGFGYLMPQMPVYEVETLPAAQTPVVPVQSTAPPNISINANKVKPFGLKSKTEIQAEQAADAKAQADASARQFYNVMRAKENGTYSWWKERLGLYN